MQSHHDATNGVNAANLQISANRLRQPQARSRISRFIIPGLNLQLTATTPALASAALTTAALTTQQPVVTGQANLAARHSNLPYNRLSEILQGFEPQIQGAAYDMFVSGIFNPQLNSTQEVMTFNETGENSTNLYIIRTPLARWNEECNVLDSHSMHHAILLVKPKIFEALEKYRNEELAEKRDKRAKDEEKLKKMKDPVDETIMTEITSNKTLIEENVANTVGEEIKVDNSNTIEANVENDDRIVEQIEPTANDERVDDQVQVQQIANNESAVDVQPVQIEENASEVTTNVEMSEVTDTASNEEKVNTEANLEGAVSAPVVVETIATSAESAVEAQAATAEAAVQQTPEELAISQEAATTFLVNFLSGTCNIFTVVNADEKRVAVEALRISDNQRAAQELASINIETYPQNFVFLDSKY